MNRSILLLLVLLAACGSDQGGLFAMSAPLDAGAEDAAHDRDVGSSGSSGAPPDAAAGGGSGAPEAGVDSVSMPDVNDAAEEPEVEACQAEWQGCLVAGLPDCCAPLVCHIGPKYCGQCRIAGGDCDDHKFTCCQGLYCQFDGISAYRCQPI